MLEIRNLSVQAEAKVIFQNFSLSIEDHKLTALMGPNGSGKSTLAQVIAGHPLYQVIEGEIFWEGENILELKPEERSLRGIFLAFQYPPTIPGVSVAHFLRLILNAQEKWQGKEQTKIAPFLKILKAQMKILEIPWAFAERSVNEGFSGGEKKRLEMLQMLILQPTLVILDEVDSGLDIDAIKLVAKTAQSLDRSKTTLLVITHYQRLLNYLHPDVVHILKDGIIVRSGSADLAQELDLHGYSNL